MTEATPDPARAATPGAPPGPRKGFLRQVLRLAGPYWHCERRVKVRSATLLLFLLTMAQVGISVWSNYWHGALFDALEQRSVPDVLLQIGIFALILAISVAVTAGHLAVKRWLQIDWRAWLTEELVRNWMADGRHYRLLFQAGDHHNPDQRIAEDIQIATDSAIIMAHTLIYSLVTLGLFINILWSVSGAIVVPGTAVQVPGYMVPLAFIYAAVGSAFGWMLGRPLVRATNDLQTAEARFRFGLSRALENTEAIALMRGESLERAGSSKRFSQIVREWDRQSLCYMWLVSFAKGYGTLLPVFPILVAAPQYIQGAMSLGALMQAAQAFQRLTSALSWPVDNISGIARCRASADRVLSLYEDMRQLDASASAQAGPRIAVARSDRAHLKIEDLCIAEPGGRILLEHFNVDIRHGERVLITGDSVVTGSLFKVIGGLWPWGSGRVWLPGDGGMLFLAHRPFLAEATLRETLCYPHPPDAFPDSAILHALECAGLAWLAPRLDDRSNWEQELLQRAQQRLGLARVFLQRPAWVFMEGATDAFDSKGERLILEMLHRELPNATLLNISFHTSLSDLHHRTLVLNRVSETKILFAGPPATGAH
ncbi:MAG: ABC transporter ATP-binding protein/permease [Desulfurivibrio sp.]|nr:MAG: ABC transporter ATP-binding protein/permease [Desulfurivibrio sp.]